MYHHVKKLMYTVRVDEPAHSFHGVSRASCLDSYRHSLAALALPCGPSPRYGSNDRGHEPERCAYSGPETALYSCDAPTGDEQALQQNSRPA
jgi:hypothetical protein